MFPLLLSFALALTPSDADLQKIAHDFAYAFEAHDISAFQRLAAAGEPLTTSETWADERKVLRMTACIEVGGARSTVIRIGDEAAIAIVDIEGVERIRANGRIIPFRSPWTLRLQHDAGGWRIHSALLTSSELRNAFAAGEAAYEAVRFEEGFARPADLAYEIANAASDGHMGGARVEQAIDHAEAIAYENHDAARVAFCEFSRVRASWGSRDFEHSIAMGKEAVAHARAAGDPDVLGAALFGLALVEIRGHPDDALAHNREAAELLPQLVNYRITIASLQNIASIEAGRGDYRNVMKTSRQGLEILRDNPWPDAEASFLCSLMSAYVYLHDFRTAREYGRKALATLTTKPGAEPLADVLSTLGAVEYELGDYAAGDEHFRQLKAVRENWETCPTRETYGESLAAHGRLVEAEKELREIVEYAHQRHEGACAAAALTTLSELRVQQGRFDEAVPFARQALSETFEKDINNPELSAHWRAQVALGRALARGGKTEEGIASLQAALDEIESERSDVVEVAQTSFRFMTDKLDAYHVLIDVLLSAKRTREAFAVAERMRGRTLIASFNRKAAMLGYTPEERARERELEARLNEINRNILAARGAGDAKRMATLHGELASARTDLDRFDEETHFIHASAHAREVLATDPAELRLPDALAGTTLVEYVVMEHATVAFTLHGAHVAARRLPIGRAALARKVEGFCRRIEARDLAYADAAKQLYALLLAPLDLGDARTIAIVPDLELWRLPFQALIARDGRFLIEHAGVFYTPSLAMLRKARDIRGAAPKEETLLAFGNPVVSGAAAAKLRDIGFDDAIRPLPDAEREVRSIAELYGARSRVFVRAAASESTFKQEAAHFDVLHLATHGFLDDESPMYSSLLFAPASDAPGDDGLLETREILRLRLHARTAVLAACDTGRGATGPGEGVIGISWAFLMAGCPTTVVTQWKAASASAAQLMIDFHRHLQHGASNARALRAAQVAMLHEQTLRHPFYWAAFVVVGAP